MCLYSDPLENFENEGGFFDFYPDYCVELNVLYSFIFAYCVMKTGFGRRLFGHLIVFAESVLGSKKALEFNFLIKIVFKLAIASSIGCLFPASTYMVPTDLTYPFSFSIAVFVLLLWVAFRIRGVDYVIFFINVSVPRSIVSALFFIEMLSVLIRVISLGLRMFANATAGGILVKVFCFYIAYFTTIIFPFAIFGAFTGILLLCILLLEIVVTILQAFVFTILFIIYLNEIT
jgi:F0F1-type ATP synthase membrane subunit a